jgi:hypothetical protein
MFGEIFACINLNINRGSRPFRAESQNRSLKYSHLTPMVHINWREAYFIKDGYLRKLLDRAIEDKDLHNIKYILSIKPSLSNYYKRYLFGCVSHNYNRSFLIKSYYIFEDKMKQNMIYEILIHITSCDFIDNLICFYCNENIKRIIHKNGQLPQSMAREYKHLRLRHKHLNKYIKIACVCKSYRILEYILNEIPQTAESLVEYFYYLIIDDPCYYGYNIECISAICCQKNFDPIFLNMQFINRLLNYACKVHAIQKFFDIMRILSKTKMFPIIDHRLSNMTHMAVSLSSNGIISASLD